MYWSFIFVWKWLNISVSEWSNISASNMHLDKTDLYPKYYAPTVYVLVKKLETYESVRRILAMNIKIAKENHYLNLYIDGMEDQLRAVDEVIADFKMRNGVAEYDKD